MPRASEGFDEFGNPRGRAFDLGGGDERRVKGEKILFYDGVAGSAFAETELRQVMADRGMQFDLRRGCDLTEQLLAGYTQLWFASGPTETLTPHQVRMIVTYVRAGNGLAIWADNDPLYADANLLAEALIGTNFRGNKPADRIMVPGPEQAPGRFIEHPLTQGVNNLYEGVTICTIHPAKGVTILGQSHDGQLCVGCFEREGQRIVLDTGFTKLYTGYFHKSAGLGRYLSNIAFWLARGSRGVEYQLLTPGRDRIETISRGDAPKGYQFTVAGAAAVTCILQWDGKATLGLTVRAPDGTVAGREESARSPIRVAVPARARGTWVAQVDGIDVKADSVPYVVTLSHEQQEQEQQEQHEQREQHGQAGGRGGGQEAARVVLPFYFVCDVSAAAGRSIEYLNAAFRHIQRDLVKDPRLDGLAMMSVIAFNDTARTVVPLTAPSKMTPPTFTAGGGRSYGAALREYHRAFEQDRARLKAGGAKIARPSVFFLTQGDPDDEDHAAIFRSLLAYDPATKAGNRAYPNIMPIGLTGGSARALAALAYPDFGDPARRGHWFLTEPATPVPQIFRSVVDAVCRTIRDAGATVAQGTPTFTPPASIPGTVAGTAAQVAGMR